MADKIESQTPIRVGLVGIGNWARYGHIPAIKLLAEYELSAIYSQRPDAAEAAAAQYGFTYVAKTLDELANHPGVDLVVVLTTPTQHEEGICAAITARKAVYSEWPLTPSIGSSEELVRLANAAGIRTTVGLHRRLAPHNRYPRRPAKKRIRRKTPFCADSCQLESLPAAAAASVELDSATAEFFQHGRTFRWPLSRHALQRNRLAG